MASTTAQGKVELATTAEAVTGTDTARAVTPSGMTAAVDYRAVRTISPLDTAYGAAGDNTTDDTAAVQAALTAAASLGLAVDLRGKTYKTTDTLTVPAGSTLTNGAIRCTGTGKKIVEVTGSNVTIRKVTITGRHATATYAANESAIYVTGASAADPITGLVIEDCTITLVGMYGILLKWVTGFRIQKCEISAIGYAGVMLSSAIKGNVDRCRIVDILAGLSGNGYGIACSREETNSLSTDPHTANIWITDNYIRNIPWEGVDTHGGEDIKIIDNQILGCRVGVQCGESDNASNVPTWAPKRIEIRRNTIDSLVTDGSAASAICFVGVAGASAAVAANDYATGVIADNILRRHGLDSVTIAGALFIRNTYGLQIMGNRFEEPSPHGIYMYYDNRSPSIVGNTFVDVWSNNGGSSDAGAITGGNANNTNIVASSNVLLTSTKSATYVNRRGLYLNGTTSSATLSNNYFTVAVTITAGAAAGSTVGRTGWAKATGTATRTTFDTSTVTTAQLAERVKALIDDLWSDRIGMIGT